ncbi:methionyl-tRNA synthetase [Actinoplanes sp. SE50]|uniref:methionine--tRNA ligase n=1 Tax=unclassified Actinoplanes TaxID=2626549 RepID=UPI00023ED23C|nr:MULTISPECIES: methionine--tRNA ligase [unclassified Actinoplanes]AEV84418.1 methionyl-tRNA synthetase [Actinoplanes sp. SE50/110]ATO82810.1 methionyl-tRNA synthetase [Actinoplanes sp. SE50]SLM00218.1 methionine--tRNA ligase [Actinoplanes sp. SE50/110]
MSLYVTTAIPYVNAAPHLGHALELVQADVLARHRRLRGAPVRFLTGTDENALKNVSAAAAAGVPVTDFVAGNAARFANLAEVLDLSVDDFIRTGSDPRHAPGVERLWRQSAARGDFYQRAYEGLYCPGCEQFLSQDSCPEHRAAPEVVRETNWFFRLSRYAGAVLDALESGRVRIEPATRRAEVLSFVRAGLADISVSRPAARAAGWGIPVPGDPTQVVYVWWDALAGYLTALDGSAYREWWVASSERVHVIGKGIVRFLAVYWLALLLSAGRPLPTAIFVHDYLTVDGAKISKSTGTAVSPDDLVARYGVDAVRWWLLRDVARVGDTDFTEPRLVTRYHQDLANGLGNLVNRTLTLVHRLRAGIVACGTQPPRDLPDAVDRALAAFDFRAATDAIAAGVADANRLIEAERPWELDGDRLDEVLAALVATCRTLARELSPFVPGGAARLSAQLGAGPRVGAPRPAFLRLG